VKEPSGRHDHRADVVALLRVAQRIACRPHLQVEGIALPRPVECEREDAVRDLFQDSLRHVVPPFDGFSG
jgi:hypothetical protein